MKADIHPDYTPIAIKCACGAVIETRSTTSLGNIDICAECHPFYTGKQKLMDTAGRVERFRKKYAKKSVAPAPQDPPAEEPASSAAPEASEAQTE